MTSPAAVLAAIRGLQGKGCISGQFTEIKGMAQIEAGGAIASIAASAGKWPGLIGGDYWWFGSTTPAADTTFNAAAIAYAAAGGLAKLTLSMPNPTTGGYSGDVSSLDASGLLKTGTAANTKLLATLDSIAAGLAALQTAGVPVIVRPYHESNGNWFWWGTKLLTAAQFVALWQFTHDYLTKTKGLSNLLWQWSVNAGFATFPALPLYPGDAYVDLTGLDVYSSAPGGVASDVAALAALHHPVCMAEFGSGSPSTVDPAFDMAALVTALKGPLSAVVMWQQWWSPWGMETAQNTAAALNDPWVYKRGDISFAPAATAKPAASTVPGLLSKLDQATALLATVRAGLALLS